MLLHGGFGVSAGSSPAAAVSSGDWLRRIGSLRLVLVPLSREISPQAHAWGLVRYQASNGYLPLMILTANFKAARTRNAVMSGVVARFHRAFNISIMGLPPFPGIQSRTLDTRRGGPF